MAEESKPSSSSPSSTTTTAGEEEEGKVSPSPVSRLVRNPGVVPPTKKVPLSHEDAGEAEAGGGEERPHPRGTKRLRKNRPKVLEKIHPSDDDEDGEGGGGKFSFLGFDTSAYSPQFTPKFGSFAGSGEGDPEERRE